MIAASEVPNHTSEVNVLPSTTKLMKPDFDFDTTDFKQIMTKKCFVDKTLLIRTILAKKGARMLITAPRRFGKSVNISMLKTFLEIQVEENGNPKPVDQTENYQLFVMNNLKIAEDAQFIEEHLGQYPVILLDFTYNHNIESYNDIGDIIRKVLHATYQQHTYLLNCDDLWTRKRFSITEDSTKDIFLKYWDPERMKSLTTDDFGPGVQFLCEILCKHFQKPVFLLVDDCDLLIRSAIFSKTIKIKKVINLISEILQQWLKSEKCIDSVLLTGTSHIAAGITGMNKIKVYTFLEDHEFVTFYGLTTDEVDRLMTKFSIPNQIAEEAHQKYKGYLSKSNIPIYSLWSILHFLQRQEFKNYSATIGYIENLGKVLTVPIIRYCFEKLILYEGIDISVPAKLLSKDITDLQEIILHAERKLQLGNYHLFFTFMLELGYLTYTDVQPQEHKRGKKEIYNLKIPNAETSVEYRKGLETYYIDMCNLETGIITRCAAHFDLLSSKSDKEAFITLVPRLTTLLKPLEAQEKELREVTLFWVLFAAISKSQYRLCNAEAAFSNRKPDLIFYKEDCGLVIEIKYKESSRTALHQIIGKKYSEIFEMYNLKIRNMVLMGVNVNYKMEATISYINCALDANLKLENVVHAADI